MKKTLRVSVWLLGIFLGSAAALGHEAHHHHPATGDRDGNRPKVLNGESIYQLTDRWDAQDGRKVSLSSLAGAPVVVAMVYTSCESACPMTVSDLKRIESALSPAARAKTRFAVFSFDSKRDVAETLAKYAKARSLDPDRWTLFHGSKSAVRKLAAVLGIRYREDASGNFDHSNVITLVDAEGVIRSQQVGLGGVPSEIAGKIETLVSGGNGASAVSAGR